MNIVKNVAFLEKNHCTGCGGCANVCPINCISMQPDEEGFNYPVVGSECTSCGNCVAKCPAICPPALPDNQNKPQVYAAWSLDEKVRENSTSGGIFSELAKWVLSHEGYVAGAKYNETHRVEHAVINKAEDIPLLRQSKYIQSEIKNTYRQIKKVLACKKQVLFIGTPCQCAALQNYLQCSYDNLILCDFICRGVNSPLVYDAYLRELEQRYGAAVAQVWFKNKTFGWNRFGTKVIFSDGQEYFGGRDEDPFLFGYIKKNLNLYMRPSCGQCEFKGCNRFVDITLGDFWGIVPKKSSADIEKGVSAVLVHSQKGKELIKGIEKDIYMESHELGELLIGNRCLVQAAEHGKERELFWKAFSKESSLENIIRGMKGKIRYES